jgi:hypothetical protein
MSQPPVPRAISEAAEPSPLAATAMLILALAWGAYFSPQRWAAAGLACMTGSALVAAPELLERLLRLGTHPHVERLGAAIAKGARRLSIFSYALFALFVLFLALFEVTHLRAATTAAIALAAVVAALEFVSRQTASFTREIVRGGDLDRTIDARFQGWRWPVAGFLFLAGTLLQFVGTFVD